MSKTTKYSAWRMPIEDELGITLMVLFEADFEAAKNAAIKILSRFDVRPKPLKSIQPSDNERSP